MRVKNSSHKFTWLLVHAKKSKMSKRYVEWWRLDRDLKINLVSLDSIDWWRFLFIRTSKHARLTVKICEKTICARRTCFVFLSFYLFIFPIFASFCSNFFFRLWRQRHAQSLKPFLLGSSINIIMRAGQRKWLDQRFERFTQSKKTTYIACLEEVKKIPKQRNVSVKPPFLKLSTNTLYRIVLDYGQQSWQIFR